MEAHRLRAIRDAQRFLVERAASEEAAYLDRSAAAATKLAVLFAQTADLAELAFAEPTPATIEIARFLTIAAPTSQADLDLVTFDMEKPAKRVEQLAFIAMHLDPLRFPWLGADREPTDEERRAAIAATAGIIARQQGSTDRRSVLGKRLEAATADVVEAAGYTRAKWPSLAPGEYCGATKIHGAEADLIVRLWDGRLLLIECKASLSEVNSYKRVDHEANGKPAKWARSLLGESIVPVTVLAGAMGQKMLAKLREQGMTLIWEHHLAPLVEIVNENRPA